DCMTLLLCFFVLLLTFSSFDEESLQRFSGFFAFDASSTGINEVRTSSDSMVKAVVQLDDKAREGAEMPQGEEARYTDRRPQSHLIVDSDAYRDRRIIRLPSKWLFKHGWALSDRGRGYLNMVEKFVRHLDCRIVISETTPGYSVAGKRFGSSLALARAWAVMSYLADEKGLPIRRLNVSAFPQRGSEERMRSVEVVLLASRKID
ncbi:MAG: hypothetical protein J7M14_08030, partial [Planctomycetes bacterium]|nr:hypothetical protein [Planctomycetota bacterium]